MANELQMIMIEFHGQAELIVDDNDQIDSRRNNFEQSRHRKMIQRLNNNSIQIAQEIQRELRRVLPPSIRVQSQINFDEGSIEWSGVILLIQGMGLVVDFVGFGEIIKKLTEITIDRVVRRWLFDSGETVEFNGSTQINFVGQPIQKSPSEISAQFRMGRLLVYNTIILAILLLIELLPTVQSIITFLQNNRP